MSQWKNCTHTELSKKTKETKKNTNNPIDPNLAISARAVFPQSGHIRPEKQPFFQKKSYFSRIEPYKKYEPLIGLRYIKLKPMRISIKC